MAHQEKLTKWHLFTHAWNLNSFRAKWLHLKWWKIVFFFKRCPWFPSSGWKWMNWIISISTHRISFLFSLLITICYFKYETIVSGRALSFGHSYPDPSSVISFHLVMLPHDMAVQIAPAYHQIASSLLPLVSIDWLFVYVLSVYSGPLLLCYFFHKFQVKFHLLYRYWLHYFSVSILSWMDRVCTCI